MKYIKICGYHPLVTKEITCNYHIFAGKKSFGKHILFHKKLIYAIRIVMHD